MSVIIVCVPVLMCDPAHLESLVPEELSQAVMNHASFHLSNKDLPELPPLYMETTNLKSSSERISTLTPREIEVLVQVANGKTYKEIARILGISPHTVSGYKKEIYRKLKISSVAEATQAVIKYQIAA